MSVRGWPRRWSSPRTRLLAAASVLGGLVSAGLLSAGAAGASTLVPCTGPGGGPAGLVAAIKAANVHGGGTVDLAASCTYTLTVRDNATDNGNGLPIVRTPITINGNHSTVARSSAATTPLFRLFEVATSGALTLDRLTVTGGKTTNQTFPGGGGILDSGGKARLTNSRVTNNTSGEGGGLLEDRGGAVTVLNSQIDHNRANTPSESIRVIGGGGVEVDSSSLTLTGTSVTDNFAENFGGGILMGDSGGHGVQLISSTVSNNTSNGNDGGITEFSGRLDVIGTLVSHNRAFDNGGMSTAFFATATLRNSEVRDNVASAPEGVAEAGGISAQNQVTLINTPVHDNLASGQTADGAGIFNVGALTLVGSPVFHNTATASGGAAQGGGLDNVEKPSTRPSGVATLTDSPVTDNTVSGTSSLGGGIFNTHQVTLSSSPVTGNHPNNCRPVGSVPGCTG